MTVLIMFETVEGQTAKIARFAEETVRTAGHAVRTLDLSAETSPDFDGVRHVILAASVHQRRHPRDFEATVAAQHEVLESLPTLMLSVSLSAAFAEGLDEAQDYLDEMKMRTGLRPTVEALVAGAVKTSKYDYFAMQVVRHVVLKGHNFDASVEEHEFTDWDALRSVVERFLTEC